MLILNSRKNVRAQARRRRSRSAAYMEFLESRVLLSFSGSSLGGPWTYAGMGASGSITFDTAGGISGGFIVNADGSEDIPSGSYGIGPVSGVVSVNLDGDVKSGAITSTNDLIALSTPGQGMDFSNSLTLLVRHDFVTYAESDLVGTWQLFLNGNDADATGYGTIIFNGSGSVTGGATLGAEGTTSITGGTYTFGTDGQLTVDVNILEPDLITAGSASLKGWLNSTKDTLALNPVDFVTAAAGGNTRLIVAVHQSGAYTNASLQGIWEFVGDGYKGAMAFDGLGHIRGNGVETDGTAIAVIGAYSMATDGTWVSAITVVDSSGSEAFNFAGALNAGGNFAAMSQFPFDFGTDSSADSLVLLVKSGGQTTTRSVGGDWTWAGTDLKGSISFDDASVPPTGTQSTDSTGNVISGSLQDTSNNMNAASGIYSLDANAGFALVGIDTFAGAYNSSFDVIALNQPDLDQTLSVLVSGGTATFSDHDLAGSWFVALNGPDGASNGFGTLEFNDEGGIEGGSIKTGTGTGLVTGGNYLINADGTCTISIDILGVGTLSFVGAMNARKDVVGLAPADPQAAAVNQTSNLTLLVRPGGAYTNASLSGRWAITTETGHGFVNFNGSGAVTGSFTNSAGSTVNITGNYVVAAGGTLTATFKFGTVTQKFSGAINGSRNVIVQHATAPSSGALTVLTSGVNRPATMTAVSPLNVAVVGQDLTITYSQLLAASNAVDLDGDALTFRITALGSGQLAINGNPVSVPTVFTSTDVLTWTPPSGTGGTFTAFSVSVTDGSTNSTAAVAVAINTIVTGVYSPGDLNNFWTVAGVGMEGFFAFDGAGNLSGGTITDDSGVTDTPSGTYTIDPAGGLTIVDDIFYGALNSSKDVAVVSNTDDSSLTVIVSSQDGLNYTNADLNGTWTVEFHGGVPDSNGGGTITFNGAGLITGGSVKAGASTIKITGSYQINSDGTLNVTITDTVNGGDLFMHGALNSSKDLVALSPDDLAAAVANEEPELMLLVRSTGTYSNADGKGTWYLNGDGANGFITLDGAGKVRGGAVTIGSPDAPIATITGTYTISSAGKVTLNGAIKQGAVSESFAFAGAMNSRRNLIILNQVGATMDGSLTVLTSTQDHAPTLKTITPLATATGAQPFTITYDDLIDAADEADLEGDPIAFQVTSMGAGTFLLNSAAVPAVPFLFSPGDSLEWTPIATAKGNVTWDPLESTCRHASLSIL